VGGRIGSNINGFNHFYKYVMEKYAFLKTIKMVDENPICL
jgi:hypothetical protein